MSNRESTERYIESLDDTTPAWRLFLLDRHENGTTEIVCSRLLTERAAMRRSHEADRSRCPTVVAEARLTEYRKLAPADTMRNFMSDSDFGPNHMFWELLSRARDRRLESTP